MAPISSPESATNSNSRNNQIHSDNLTLSLGTIPQPQFNFNLPFGQRSVPVSNSNLPSNHNNLLFNNSNITTTNSSIATGIRSAQIIDEIGHNVPRTPGGSLVIGSEIFGFGKSTSSASARDRWSTLGGEGSNAGERSPGILTPRAVGILSDSNSYNPSSAPWPHEFERALNNNMSSGNGSSGNGKFELVSSGKIAQSNQNTTDFNLLPTHPALRSYHSTIDNRSSTLSQLDEVASHVRTPTAAPASRPGLGRSKSHIVGPETSSSSFRAGSTAEDDSKLNYGFPYGIDTFPSTQNYLAHQQQQQHQQHQQQQHPASASASTSNSFQQQQRALPVPERATSYQNPPPFQSQSEYQFNDQSKSSAQQQQLSLQHHQTLMNDEFSFGIQNLSIGNTSNNNHQNDPLSHHHQPDYYPTQSNYSNNVNIARNNSNHSTNDSFNDYSSGSNSIHNSGDTATYYRRGSAGSINPIDLRSRDSGYAASPPHFNHSQNANVVTSNLNGTGNSNTNGAGNWQEYGVGSRGSYSNNSFTNQMNSMNSAGMGTGNLDNDLSFLTGPASLLINSNTALGGNGMTQQQQLLLIRQNQRNLNLNQNAFNYSDYTAPPPNLHFNLNSNNNRNNYRNGNNFETDNNSSRNSNNNYTANYGGGSNDLGNYAGVGDDPSRVIRSPLLEEFRTNRHRSWELFDLANHIVEFSGDQLGSRHIQQKLDTASHEERQLVYEEILPNMLLLSTDVFANYVIQKLFEQGTQVQKTGMATLLEGHVLALSLQMYGCRVVQKALEYVLVDQQVRLIRELDGHVLKCARDAQSNHVVQRALERVPSDQLIFITDACIGQVQALATHPYGCRVLQRIFENCPSSQTRILLDDLHRYTQNLIQDQYGNYVIQWIVEKGDRADRSLVISKVCGQLLALAQQKFASNVIEKCIIYAEENDRRRLVEEVLRPMEDGSSVVRLMLSHPYANYVFQKILVTTTGPLKDALIAQTTTQLAQLRKFSTSYSKHLITIEKLLISERSRGSM